MTQKNQCFSVLRLGILAISSVTTVLNNCNFWWIILLLIFWLKVFEKYCLAYRIKRYSLLCCLCICSAARWQNDNTRKYNYLSFTELLIKDIDIRGCVPYCFPLQNFAVFEFFSRLCLLWLLLMGTKELRLKLTVVLEWLIKCFMKIYFVNREKTVKTLNRIFIFLKLDKQSFKLFWEEKDSPSG